MQELDDLKQPMTPQHDESQGEAQGQEPLPEPEAPTLFATPAESTSSLSFREDSANLPAPAPFQVISQPGAAPTPEPFSSQIPEAPVAEAPVVATPTEPPPEAPATPTQAVPPLAPTSVPPPFLSDVTAPVAPPVAEATPPESAPAPLSRNAPVTPTRELRPQVETQPLSTLEPNEVTPAVTSRPIPAAAPTPNPAPVPDSVESGAAPVTAPSPSPTVSVAAPAPSVHQPSAPPPYQGPDDGTRRLQQAVDVMSRLRRRMRAQILGRDDVIDLVLVALLADGHVLLEDFPGSGKTTLAKSLGSSIVNPQTDEAEAQEDRGIADFRRIQFTPDLLPSDVTGVSVFDVNTHRFDFRRGPIFAHVVLADEINRTSPKVQSAMLEAMAEKQVTVDNTTYPLDPLFFVIATQNPLDLAGTYPLPVAQLDRFLFKIRMHHIDRQAELEVLNTYRQRRDMERRDLPKVTRLDVLAARRAIDEQVAIEQPVKECLVDIAHRLRGDERVLQGNSTRSLVLILPALQALATLRGRDFVSGDDIQTLIPRVLGHRVELAPGVTDMDQVLTEVMEGPIEALSRSTLRRRR